ncbi:glycosyltransferase family 2 protein [Dactylosporangium matsuzakiense]|nr:glycosyltransferase family 2 protein [Dactylosporangium matsuzakiense]UWZ43623.1 glycosyltransferase family 2 protein [Dactylosporangium matsuzakiense]
MTLAVSIVMPVYNVERHIGRTIAALLALRVPNNIRVSLIIVDDASTDASMEVAGALLRESPFPVSVLRHPVNLGLSVARNTGLAAAGGDFVWFVDSDDWVTPDLLEAFARAAAPDVDIVITDMVPVHEDGGTGRPMMRRTEDTVWTGPAAVEEFLFQRIRAFMMNKLIRRDLFDDLEFPPGRLYEDVGVCARLLRRARAVAFVAGPAYLHLQRRASITGSFTPRILDLYTGVLDACTILSTEPNRASAAGLLHFRLRAGVMSVVEAAARARGGEAGTSVVEIVRRDLHFKDIFACVRHRLWLVALSVLLIRLAPTWYARLYRAARFLRRRRERRLGARWRGLSHA